MPIDFATTTTPSSLFNKGVSLREIFFGWGPWRTIGYESDFGFTYKMRLPIASGFHALELAWRLGLDDLGPPCPPIDLTVDLRSANDMGSVDGSQPRTLAVREIGGGDGMVDLRELIDDCRGGDWVSIRVSHPEQGIQWRGLVLRYGS